MVFQKIAYRFKLSPSRRIARQMLKLAKQLRKLEQHEKSTVSHLKDLQEKIIEDTTSIDKAKKLEHDINEFCDEVDKLAPDYQQHLEAFYREIVDGEALIHRELEEINKLKNKIAALARARKIPPAFAQRLMELIAVEGQELETDVNTLKRISYKQDRGRKGFILALASDKRIYREMRNDARNLRKVLMDEESLENELDKAIMENNYAKVESLVRGLNALFRKETQELTEEERDARIELFRFKQKVAEHLQLIDDFIAKLKTRSIVSLPLIKRLTEARDKIAKVLAAEQTMLHTIRLQAKTEAKEARAVSE